MGCATCANNKNGGTPAGCKSNGTCASGGCDKLAVFDWLSNMELPSQVNPFEYIEVRFKNSRKDFYRNALKSSLNPGDAIVVEGSPGYDVGIVSASGEIARMQMQKKNALKNTRDLKKTLRRASTEDLTIWRDARAAEEDTMHRARKISQDLGLEMKISDVEYQGDFGKAIFYYTADGRVDFRELIKKYADSFKVRIEMKQIGARQEAGRLGGIGSCGRELCCSTWLTDFRSVSTSAARYQQLALNTQKLAGQCGKLKCCLNFELDTYLDALQDFPKHFNKLKTKKGVASHLKTDIFKGIMWYILDDGGITTPIALEKDRVKEILEMNQKGKMPEDLKQFMVYDEPKEPESFTNVVGQDSLTRFDDKKPSRNKRRKKRPQGSGQRGSKQGNQQPKAKNQPRQKAKGQSNKGGKKPNQQGGKPGGSPQNKKRNTRRKPGGGPKPQNKKQ